MVSLGLACVVVTAAVYSLRPVVLLREAKKKVYRGVMAEIKKLLPHTRMPTKDEDVHVPAATPDADAETDVEEDPESGGDAAIESISVDEDADATVDADTVRAPVDVAPTVAPTANEVCARTRTVRSDMHDSVHYVQSRRPGGCSIRPPHRDDIVRSQLTNAQLRERAAELKAELRKLQMRRASRSARACQIATPARSSHSCCVLTSSRVCCCVVCQTARHTPLPTLRCSDHCCCPDRSLRAGRLGSAEDPLMRRYNLDFSAARIRFRARLEELQGKSDARGEGVPRYFGSMAYLLIA